MTTNVELAAKAVADIKNYSDVDEAVVTAMVRSYGLVMRKADTRLVACGDPEELATVKQNFLKKKLGLSQGDSELDAMIQKVCNTMKASNHKNRLTFYYLLAKDAGKLGVFA